MTSGLPFIVTNNHLSGQHKKSLPKNRERLKNTLLICFVIAVISVISDNLSSIFRNCGSNIVCILNRCACVIVKRFTVHQLVEVLAVDLFVFHKVMSDLVELISVAEQYLLCVFVACVNKLTDLAVNFCRNVFGVVSALRIISAEEYFRVIVSR